MNAITLSGVNVQRASMYVPATGLWHLDVLLQDAVDPGTTARVFQFNGFTATCAALRNIQYASSRGLRLVAGAGGWRTIIPPRWYNTGAVFNLSIVVQDAAAIVKELAPVIAVDQQIAAYTRVQGPAVRALDMFAPWWCDFTGTVQTGPRDLTPIASAFTLLDVDRADGKYTIATDTLGDWTPGRSFVTPTIGDTITRVYHEITPEAVRTYAWGSNLQAGTVVS